MKKKIAIITATRAEYGLLRPLIVELMKTEEFDCKVIVTGTHLLDKYGYTVRFIEQDKIPIQHLVSIMNEEDNEQCEVISRALVAFSEIYKKEKYDAIVVLGDRYELFGFCIPALLQRIPIIHIHGGEKTEGAVDEKIRHAVTKMASIHFPSVNEYADRIIQMGENPEFVFPVGALGIDNALKINLLEKEVLEKELGIDFSNTNVAVVTYHPVTMDGLEDAENQIKVVLETLVKQPLFLLITMPNSDEGGDRITKVIMEYAYNYPSKIKFVKSLGQLKYLSCLKYAAIVIGNSSSGIIETASFKIPTIDIGDRQRGRLAPANVIHCECEQKAIEAAIHEGLSKDFRNSLNAYINPYGDGNAAGRMVNILKKINWKDERLLKKQFYDLYYGKR